MRTDGEENIHGITYISVVTDGRLKAKPFFHKALHIVPFFALLVPRLIIIHHD